MPFAPNIAPTLLGTRPPFEVTRTVKSELDIRRIFPNDEGRVAFIPTRNTKAKANIAWKLCCAVFQATTMATFNTGMWIVEANRLIASSSPTPEHAAHGHL